MTGLTASPVSAVPGTTIASATYNSNNVAILGTNTFSAGGVLIQNGDFYQCLDSSAVARNVLQINASDNDVHIRTSPAHGLLKITNNSGSADIAQFNETAGLQIFGG